MMFDESGIRSALWPLIDGGSIEVPGQLVLGDLALLKKAILAGIGIALISEGRIRQELESGQVTRVLPEIVGGHVTAYAVYLDREYLPAQLQVFIEGLKTYMSALDN